jgi:hypothetical protein
VPLFIMRKPLALAAILAFARIAQRLALAVALAGIEPKALHLVVGCGRSQWSRRADHQQSRPSRDNRAGCSIELHVPFPLLLGSLSGSPGWPEAITKTYQRSRRGSLPLVPAAP